MNEASEPHADTALVGVFDSGLGGLTVVAALHDLMPALSVRYIADTAYFPYGDREPALVADRSLAMGEQLVAEGCRLIVVACNTASSAALELLRDRLPVPIVGMEPPLKPAAERTRSGRIAVLVTAQTAEGDRLARLRAAHAGDHSVRTIPLPGLADLVEQGEVDGERVRAILDERLRGLAADGVDHVALGCTHYGFLRPALHEVLGPAVELIDAAQPVARRVRQQLLDHGVVLPSGDSTGVRCTVTGDPAAFERAVARLRAGGVQLPPIELVREAAA